MAIQGLEFDKPTLVDGGHEQKAIVNTASGKQPVNAPTVEDIKRIAKGEAEQAAEAASATEWEKSVKDNIFINSDGYLEIKNGESSIIVSNSVIKFGFYGNQLEFLMEEAGIEFIEDNQAGGWSLGYNEPINYMLVDNLTLETALWVGGEEVEPTDLIQGNRIYRHQITFTDGTKSFHFVIYNSSEEEMDDFVTYFDGNLSIKNVVGRYQDSSNSTSKIATIDSTHQSLLVGYDGGYNDFPDTSTITDDVTQC